MRKEAITVTFYVSSAPNYLNQINHIIGLSLRFAVRDDGSGRGGTRRRIGGVYYKMTDRHSERSEEPIKDAKHIRSVIIASSTIITDRMSIYEVLVNTFFIIER